MTHSIGNYRKWQEQFNQYITTTGLTIPPEFHSMVFQFNIKPVPGHPPDLSNLQGGVEDGLVKHKYLKDDNWKVLKRFYTFGVKSEESAIILYFTESKQELIYIINKYSD